MSILDTHAWFTGSVHSYGSISASQGFSGSFSGDGSGLTGVVVQGVISSSSQVDHNQTANYTASRHIDHASVYITGSGGLTGGGVITTSQAIELDTNSSTFIGGVKSYAYYSSSISASSITLYKDAGGNHTLDLSGVTGGVSSYTDLTNIPANIVSSSVQIAALGFLTSSSLGLNTKVGNVPSSSFQATGSLDSYADVVFATPFSSSNYSVSTALNKYIGTPNYININNKTSTGFRIASSFSLSDWGNLLGASIDYIAIAQGETAVTSSFTELASTASYVDFTNIDNLPTLISGSSQISALGFLTSSSLGLNTKVGSVPTSSFGLDSTLNDWTASVVFATPFSSSNYSITLTGDYKGDTTNNSPSGITLFYKDKTSTGFNIVIDGGGRNFYDNIDYVAVAYGETAVTSSFTELASTASYAITASYALNSGGVSSYTELSDIPANIVSSSAQISALGFLTSSSLGLNTKVGNVPTSSFVEYKATDLSQSTRSSASLEFATPFSSSNYEVFLQISTFTDATGSNVGTFAPGYGVINKTPYGFSIVSGLDKGTWGIYDYATISYVAIADGETAVTSSFTELASTASYVDYSNIDNLPTLISGSTQISALGFLTSSSLGLNTKVGNIPSSSFQNTGSDSYADVVFATPFSSSNYSVALLLNSTEYNPGADVISFHIHNKTTTGFRIVNGYNVGSGRPYPGSSVDYIAIAQGETAVTSSFTELASTASYAITASYALNAGGVTSYTELSDIPANIVSSSAQISALGFLTSSSLGLNTKVGTIPTSSFVVYNPGIGYTNSSASVVFATPFSSSNYQVFLKPNLYSDIFGDLPINSSDPLSVLNKTSTGFDVVSTLTKSTWGSDFSFANISYVAIADGETAVTSSFTELASTASYAITASYALNGGGTATTISNNTNNYVLTATGTANTINGESKMTFNGTNLYVDGTIGVGLGYFSNYLIAAEASASQNISGMYSWVYGNNNALDVGHFSPYYYLSAGSSTYGALVGGPFIVNGTTKLSGSVSITGSVSIKGDLLPGTNELYDLGSPSNRWRDIYLSGSTVYLGDAEISEESWNAVSSSASGVGILSSSVSANHTSVKALNNASSSYLLNTTDTLDGNLTVTGIITAQEFHTEFISASIIYQSGSTKFGNSVDDTHQFTGSVLFSNSGIYLGQTQVSEASWNAVSSSSTYTYTLPAATSTVRGGVELFSDTVQSVAANAVSSTAGRTYGVQVNSDGQAVVNIPWTDTDTDTNTTYSISAETVTGGANLRLTDSGAGTDDVKIASGTNVTVTRTDANTITISSTDTNTTYTAGNGLDLTGQEFSLDTGSAHFTNGVRGKFTAGSNITIIDGEIASSFTDTNTTYSISAETVTGGANLRLTDSGAGTDDVAIKGSGATTVTRTDANTITISSTDTNTTYSVFTNSTNGLVPTPSETGTTKFLRQDGTWVIPTDTNTTYTAGNGLGLNAGAFSLDTPSTLSVSSTNGVTANSHTHAITTTTSGTASTIVATDSNSEITAANFITTSDRRLKTDITPIQEGLETIKKFVSYEYTKAGMKEAGFIAQEVQEVLPYAVREGEDGFLKMTDRAILAHMHKAILELEQKIKEIESKL